MLGVIDSLLLTSGEFWFGSQFRITQSLRVGKAWQLKRFGNTRNGSGCLFTGHWPKHKVDQKYQSGL